MHFKKRENYVWSVCCSWLYVRKCVFKGQNDGHQVDAQSFLWVSGGGVEAAGAEGTCPPSLKPFFFKKTHTHTL